MSKVQPENETHLEESELSKDLEAEYDKILSGVDGTESSKSRRVDEAYLPEKEDEDEEIEEKQEEVESDETEEQEETEEEEEETGGDKEDDGGEEEVEIPQDWVDAGRAAAMTDDKIIELAETHPEVLQAMAQFRQRSMEQPVPQSESKSEPPPKPERLKPVTLEELNLDDADEPTKRLANLFLQRENQLVDKFNQTNEKLEQFEQAQTKKQQNEQADFDRRIDTFFDKHIKDCPDLGHSINLSPAEKAVRSEVYGIAHMRMQRVGGSLEDNLTHAVNAFNVLEGRDDTKAENTLRRKLNKHKKKFTPRPGGQKTQKKYKSDDEKAFDTMDEKGREIGIW